MSEKEKRLLILLNVARAHTMTFDPPCMSAENVAKAINKLGIEVTARQINDWYNKRKLPTRKFKNRDINKILWALNKIIEDSPLGNVFPGAYEINIG